VWVSKTDSPRPDRKVFLFAVYKCEPDHAGWKNVVDTQDTQAKTFSKSFEKGIDKPKGLWYNKDSQGAVAQESRGVHTSVSRGSKPLIPQ